MSTVSGCVADRNGTPDRGRGAGAGPPVFIHVGLPKAASTTLQHELARDARLAFFGPSQPDHVALERALVDPLIFGDEPTFRARSPETARRIREVGAGRAAIVLSDEVLTWGQHAKRARQWPLAAPIPPTRTAARLAEMFPDARILLIFRSQLEWVRSHYLQMQYIDAMDRDFHRFLEEGVQPEHLYSLDTILDYDALHAAYLGAFGDARVKPVFFEEIAADSARFLADVYAWLGLEPNLEVTEMPRLNTRSRVHPAVRRAAARTLPLNRVKALAPGLFRAVKAMMPGQASDVPLTREQRRMIAARFAASNQRLAARLDRPLPPAYPGAAP